MPSPRRAKSVFFIPLKTGNGGRQWQQSANGTLTARTCHTPPAEILIWQTRSQEKNASVVSFHIRNCWCLFQAKAPTSQSSSAPPPPQHQGVSKCVIRFPHTPPNRHNTIHWIGQANPHHQRQQQHTLTGSSTQHSMFCIELLPSKKNLPVAFLMYKNSGEE